MNSSPSTLKLTHPSTSQHPPPLPPPNPSPCSAPVIYGDDSWVAVIQIRLVSSVCSWPVTWTSAASRFSHQMDFCRHPLQTSVGHLPASVVSCWTHLVLSCHLVVTCQLPLSPAGYLASSAVTCWTPCHPALSLAGHLSYSTFTCRTSLAIFLCQLVDTCPFPMSPAGHLSSQCCHLLNV